jgi:hypothetical protein
VSYQLGDVVRLSGHDGLLAMIVEHWPDGPDGSPFAQIMGLNFSPEWADNYSLVCRTDEGPWGVPFAIEAWNQRPVYSGDFAGVVGRLPYSVRRDVVSLYNRIVGAEKGRLPQGRIGRAFTSRRDPRYRFQSARFDLYEMYSDRVMHDLFAREAT